MTIEERFEKIEKQNEDLEKQNHALKNQTRKLRRLSLASIALALAALIGGTALSVRAYTAAIEPTSITTQQIILRDSLGLIRLVLGGALGDVRAYDATGKLRAAMSSIGFINVYGANGKVRVNLASDGTVRAHDSNGMNRVRLNGADNKIYFNNASGKLVKALP